MTTDRARDLARSVIESQRYLTLATSDGRRPWIAVVEYLRDEEGSFYFFSPDDSEHARHIERNPEVAVAIFGSEQPDYAADATATLNGVQMSATARRIAKDEYPDIVVAGIEALHPPMPPYAVFKIEPGRTFVPRIEDGVNVREPVS